MGISRRKFIITSGITTLGALAIGVSCSPIRRTIASFANTAELGYNGNTDDPMIWFEITPDNSVIIYSPKVEMGQGIFTGIAQLVAEELEVDIAKISVTTAPTASGNVDPFATGGSLSMIGLWEPVRELAATMREMMISEASIQLNLPKSSLYAQNGSIISETQEITYASIIQQHSGKWDIPRAPKLKSKDDFSVIGKGVKRVDLAEKVFGTANFGIDIQLENLKYACIIHPPTFNAKRISVNSSQAELLPGVEQIVIDEHFIAVIADSVIIAEDAKRLIEINWSTSEIWNQNDIEELVSVGNGEDYEIQKEGSVSSIFKKDSSKILELEFRSPLGAHAQMEPCGATVDVQKDSATVYMSTQTPKAIAEQVAEAIQMDKDKVNVITSYLGGGFGRRLLDQNAVIAAKLSKRIGKPVKLMNSRKDEFQTDPMRPPTHHIVKAVLHPDGNIQAFQHQVASGNVAFGSGMVPGIIEKMIGADIGAWRGGMIQYKKIPNYSAICWMNPLPFPTSSWRALGLLANTFAIESTLDELALSSNQNPIEFRLNHISTDEAGIRLRNTILKCQEEANYTDSVFKANGYDIAMGFACSTDVNTPCAHIAEVSLDNNNIIIHKVTCTIDAGLAVNPDQIKAQCEGAINMGVSAALYEYAYVENSKILPTIYGPYKMSTLKQAPREINVHILEGTGSPGGIGEPPLGPTAAAISNAIRRLTGKRITQMPIADNLNINS